MVYVDNARVRFRRMRMSHMIADTGLELREMAARIGLRARWIQHEGTYKEHFDVCAAFRLRAIGMGARPIGRRSLGRILVSRSEDRVARDQLLEAFDALEG